MSEISRAMWTDICIKLGGLNYNDASLVQCASRKAFKTNFINFFSDNGAVLGGVCAAFGAVQLLIVVAACYLYKMHGVEPDAAV